MTDLFAVLDATWPAAAERLAGGWRIREGRGGGKRVSCATAVSDEAEAGIAAAEAAHAAMHQDPLFCLRDGQDDLDLALAGRGYRLIEPVVLYVSPAARIAAEAPARLSAFPLWPPLAITCDIWAEGGVTAARQAVMARAAGPRTSILGRWRATARRAPSLSRCTTAWQCSTHCMSIRLPAARASPAA